MNNQRIRLLMLAAVILGGFFLLLYRLWTLQIDRQDEFVRKLPDTDKAYQRVPGVRGQIKDYNGLVLAGNETSLEIALNLASVEGDWREKNRVWEKANKQKREIPKYTYDRTREPVTDIVKILNETTFPKLHELGLYVLPASEDKGRREINAIRESYLANKGVIPYRYRKNLLQSNERDFERFVAYAENASSIPGVVIQQRPKRRYPFKAMGAHFLGYIRETKDELPKDDVVPLEYKPDDKKKNWDFFETDDVGQAGIELTQNELLHGKPGKSVWLKNEHGRLTDEIEAERINPLPGADIFLTIDARIQYLVETILRESGAGRAAAVVMEPNTGEIRAMVSIPSFDPNIFVTPKDHDAITAIYADETTPTSQRALSPIPPGSTYKLITAIAGSMTNNGGKHYNCNGSVYYGRSFQCWTVKKGQPGHGSLNLTDGIRSSCNCYFYQIGNSAGIDAIEKAARMFGIGSKLLPEVDNERMKEFPSRAWWTLQNLGPWTSAKTANISIGQGESTSTALQICLLGSTIANSGKIYQPTMIHHREEIRYDRDGQRQTIISNFEPVLRSNLLKNGVKERDMNAMRLGMLKVVNDSKGTAKGVKSTVTTIAGKTGTADNWRLENGKKVKDNLTWFMSFAPFDKPELAVTVVVWNGKSGGVTAGPVAKRIIEETLSMQAGNLKIVPQPLAPAVGSFRYLETPKFPNNGTTEGITVDDPDDPGAEGDASTDAGSVAAEPVPPKADVVLEDDVRVGATEQTVQRVRFRMKESAPPLSPIISQ